MPAIDDAYNNVGTLPYQPSVRHSADIEAPRTHHVDAAGRYALTDVLLMRATL